MRTLRTTCLAAALGLLVLLSTPARADDCPDDRVTFNFDNIDIKSAFAIFANHAGLRPYVDSSITYAGPVKFTCMEWQVAARNLAERYKLGMRIENGGLYIWKKG